MALEDYDAYSNKNTLNNSYSTLFTMKILSEHFNFKEPSFCTRDPLTILPAWASRTVTPPLP